MPKLSPALLLLLLLTMFGTAASAASGHSAAIESNGIPAGFAELTRDHETLVDVYFGGRKAGEAMVIAKPGYVRFKEPAKILSLIPNLEVSPDLEQVFAGELPSNASLVCPQGTTRGCGELAPALAGIIFDEDHFRVDVFVNSRLLRLIRPEQSLYLESPSAPLSLTSSTGFALSGSNQTSPSYNLQNQTILGFRNARIRSDSSYASGFGLVMDTLVGEVDRPGLRYSAGLFWAPGLDLTGNRRILGAGMTTQFDTRTDRDSLQGTPLVLFLAQAAHVDILIDGRLVTSGAYDAGNNVLDTSGLPDGSYSLILRIHEASGAVREERRFFAKNPEVAPVGEPIYFAYAGMLANTRRGHPINFSNDLFYQFGTARRLNQNFALDLSVIGTTKKPILEAGGWLITSLGRIRAAVLGSSRGDRGALLQVASAEAGGFNVNFDLRKIWSHDGQPLLPLSTYVDTFESVPPNQRQIGFGSYTQASGSIGYQLGSAYVAVIGSLRKDRGLRADYSIGPNLNWPVINAHGLQIALTADAQFTRVTTAEYIGARMLFTRGGYAVSSTLGRRGLATRGESRSSSLGAVGDTTAHFAYAANDTTDISLAGGVTHELDSSTGHAEAMVYSPLGSAHGELLHNFHGGNRTQYGLTFQTGAVLARGDAVIGGRNLAQSALVVSIDPDTASSEFEVLIDGQPHGRVRAGARLPIFLQPYRAYSVRLRPVNAASVWFDTAAHKFTLYPGNVQSVRWHVEHLLTVFGRAVRADGRPVADAMVTSARGVGESNDNGYFQIDTTANDSLTFDGASGPACKVTVRGLNQKSDYAAVGKVLCQ